MRSFIALSFAALALGFVLACGEEPKIAPPDEDAREQGLAPTIAAFSTDRQLLTDGESVSFTAEIEDGNGADDIVAARLVGDQDGALYGTLSETARLSSTRAELTLSLSWSAIHAVRPLEFYREEYRAFRLEVSDRAGQQASATASVRFSCLVEACAGRCIDTATDPGNCGSCRNACSGDERCAGGECLVAQMTSCIRIVGLTDESIRTCSAACEGIDNRCAAACGSDAPYYAGQIYDSGGTCDQQATVASIAGCDEDFTTGDNQRFVACCCH